MSDFSTVSPLAVVDREGLSPETVDAANAHNARVADWGAKRHKLREAVSKLAAGQGDATFAELRKRRDSADASQLALLQQAATLGREYVERQQAQLPELQERDAELQAALPIVEKAVAERLNTAGIGVETQRAYATDPDAATRQFLFQVHAHPEYRAAAQAASEATEAVNATHAAIAAGRERVAAAEHELQSFVNFVVGLPAPSKRTAAA